ncbi:predicted protein [Thalassiosira pseudonana CCMP1335]|uniref:Uncharacterized protein n=1 Tax=Thalassiosira pseudonana TaxID=35128 RepID=B8CBF4_THAPS|nr:predicted protein [Thalassiosira pseudonana CCMP1335]EED89119.1 predicted protein [Thalassiosira pseudonana CCMP1335]|eukprot:scaffold5170_cov200-Alexandrium_tamarense.AAC.20
MPSRLRRSSRLAAKSQPDDVNIVLSASPPTPRRRSSSRTNKRDSLSMLPQTPQTAKAATTKQRVSSPATATTTPSTPSSILKRKGSSSTRAHSSATPTYNKSSKIARQSSIVTPAAGVKFGANSVAEFNRRDPPTRIELMSTNMTMELFPTDTAVPSNDDDEETKRNEAILAKWDDSFDDVSDDEETSSSDDEFACGENIHEIDGGYAVVTEEEIDNHIMASPHITRRSPKNVKRPVMREDTVFCKTCNRGVIRTIKYFYE